MSHLVSELKVTRLDKVFENYFQKDFKRELYAERLEGVRTNGAANGVTNGAYRNLDFEDL